MNKLYSLQQTSTSSVLFGHRPRGYHQILEVVRYVPLVLWHPSWPPCWWNMTSFRRHFCGSEREDIWWQDLQSHKPLHPFDSTMQLPIPVEPSFKTKRNNLEFHGGLGLMNFVHEGKNKRYKQLGGLEDSNWISFCQRKIRQAFIAKCRCSLQESRLFLGAVLLSMISCFGLFDVGRSRWKNCPNRTWGSMRGGAKSCRNAKARIVANHYSYYTFCHSTCCVFNSWVCVFGPYSPCFLRIVGCLRLILLSNLAKHTCRSSQNVHEVDVWSTGKKQG